VGFPRCNQKRVTRLPEISAAMVMKLRQQTGAAMMLCKEALKETDGDFEAATVYIRKKLGGKLSGATDRTARRRRDHGRRSG